MHHLLFIFMELIWSVKINLKKIKSLPLINKISIDTLFKIFITFFSKIIFTAFLILGQVKFLSN